MKVLSFRPHEVATKKCVAYESCTPENQDSGAFELEQDFVPSFRSTDQDFHFQEDTLAPSLPPRRMGRQDRFDNLNTKLKSKSLERLPTSSSFKSRSREHEFTVASTALIDGKNLQQKVTFKRPSTPTEKFNTKSPGKPEKDGISASEQSKTKPTALPFYEEIVDGDFNHGASVGKPTPFFKSSASSICSLGKMINTKEIKLRKKKLEKPVTATRGADKIRSDNFNDSGGYVLVDGLDANKRLSDC